MAQHSQTTHNTALTVFPNPFTEQLNIAYQIAGQNGVALQLYDITGRLVKRFDLSSSASFDHIPWNGIDDNGRVVPQGVYFLRIDNLDTGGIICRKVLMVK
jgi:flagellar hook assembly protein FlgD